MTRRTTPMIALLATTLMACGSEIVVHDLSEKEANRIIEVLADHDISSGKGTEEDGRSIRYNIAVSGINRVKAIRILNRFELPRRADRGYNEVFAEGGLIPTSSEERAKQMAAIEGEIERQLKLVDNILDAQVQVVMPEESALRTTQDQIPATTASVTIKYLPGINGIKPLSEPQIAAIVAAGVEKLTADQVVVVMTPAAGPAADVASEAVASAPAGGIRGMSQKTFNMLTVGVAITILLLAGALVLTWMSLNAVRNKFRRLQAEIAKARRRPGEGSFGGA